MDGEVRVGIVGTSWWADLMHLPSVKSHPGARLAAICGRNRDRAEEMAAKYEIPLVFTDYREMLASGELDALVVSTPDDLHYPISIAALDAGLHVMCEKPLAMDSDQARAMDEKAEAAGVKHGVMFTWPWTPHYRRLQRLLDDGYLGRPRECDIRYVSSFAGSGEYLWRCDAEHALGILGDLGSHAIQFARLYVGEIVAVSAHLATLVERTRPDGLSFRPANDAGVLAVEFANGAHGTIRVNGEAQIGDHGQEQHIVLYGSDGTLESVFYFQGVTLRGVRAGEDEFSDLMDRDSPAARQGDPFAVFRTEPAGDRLFIDSILENKPFSPSFYDGWKVQQVIDAAFQSHREGRWVRLDQGPTAREKAGGDS